MTLDFSYKMQKFSVVVSDKKKKSFSSFIPAKLHFFFLIWYSVFTYLLPGKAKRTDKISILKRGQWNKKPKPNQPTTKQTKIIALQIPLHNKIAFLPLLLFFFLFHYRHKWQSQEKSLDRSRLLPTYLSCQTDTVCSMGVAQNPPQVTP